MAAGGSRGGALIVSFAVHTHRRAGLGHAGRTLGAPRRRLHGSNCTLRYDPARDLLEGTYYQAVAQQKFAVRFVRAPGAS